MSWPIYDHVNITVFSMENTRSYESGTYSFVVKLPKAKARHCGTADSILSITRLTTKARTSSSFVVGEIQFEKSCISLCNLNISSEVIKMIHSCSLLVRGIIVDVGLPGI